MKKGSYIGVKIWSNPKQSSGSKFQQPQCTQNPYPGSWVTRMVIIFLRRSGYNSLVAQLSYAHWGSGVWTVAELLVCWVYPMISPTGWRVGALKLGDNIPLSFGPSCAAPLWLGRGIMSFEAASWHRPGLPWAPIDTVARRWERLWVGKYDVKTVVWTSYLITFLRADIGVCHPPWLTLLWNHVVNP